MTWLLELLFDSLRTICAQFVVDMMDTATGVFTDLLSCDLSLFEGLFSVAGTLYRNAILPMSIAFLVVICLWQLLKTMFGRTGTVAEEPVELVGRSVLCLFLIVNCKGLVDYLLAFAGTPYSWIVGSGIEIQSFSGFVSASELAAAALGIDTMSLQLLLLVMQIVVAWNYFKLLYVVAERYVLLGIFSYTAPLAFASGGSKATNNILANWAKLFGGQLALILLDAWGLKMYLAAYGNLLASRRGFTQFFVGCLCLVGFCRIMQKLDSYLASLGLSMGRTGSGMSGTTLAILAGRMLGRAGGTYGSHNSRMEKTGGGKASRRKESEVSSGCNEFGVENGPIPMGGPNEIRTGTNFGQAVENPTGSSFKSRTDAGPFAANCATKLQADSCESHEARGSGISRNQQEENSIQQEADHDTGRDSQNSAGNMIVGAQENMLGEESLPDGTGIAAVYDDDGWMSSAEEADMNTAIEMAREMEHTQCDFAEEFDTGILATGDDTEDEVPEESIPFISPELTPTKSYALDPEGDHFAGLSRPISSSQDPSSQKGPGIAEHDVSTLVSSAGKERHGQRGTTDRPLRFTKNGQLYLAADHYEVPAIPYRLEQQNGANYYTVPESTAAGRVRAVLREDGSIRYVRDPDGGWEPKRKQTNPSARTPLSADQEAPV